MCTNTNHTCLPLCIKSKHENPYDFFHTRNSQAIQEGILLGLLNQHFDIVIEAPQKKSVVTLNYYTIIHLYNSSEYINFTNTLTNKLKEMMSEDIARNTPRGTAERRKEMNRIAESIHQLMFILQNQGYSLKTTSQGKVNSRQMVKEIMYEGIIYNEKRY
ncbi:Uncharacterized protein QTN25_002198 [Entamoeba marina]